MFQGRCFYHWHSDQFSREKTQNQRGGGHLIPLTPPCVGAWLSMLNCNFFSLKFWYDLFPSCFSVNIKNIREIREGALTDTFKKHLASTAGHHPAHCFSVIHGTSWESLDIVAGSLEEAKAWVSGLRFLMEKAQEETAKSDQLRDSYPLLNQLSLIKRWHKCYSWEPSNMCMCRGWGVTVVKTPPFRSLSFSCLLVRKVKKSVRVPPLPAQWFSQGLAWHHSLYPIVKLLPIKKKPVYSTAK